MNIAMKPVAADLRDQVAAEEIVVAPGIYDALTAHIAERAGFTSLYLSGASIAYTRFGRPDIGLVSMSEVAETLALIRDRVETPVIVDADTGFGNALNVIRTVKTFCRVGASGIQLEDQVTPKRCGHLEEKKVVPAAEMVGKIHAALDARTDERVMIIARTDAVAVEGLAPAYGREATMILRPEDVAFVPDPAGPAVVGSCEFAGGRCLLTVSVAGCELLVDHASPTVPGQTGRLRLVRPTAAISRVTKHEPHAGG